MKKNKDITLIALVIAIIIMLILVAVVIYVTIDGKQFDSAKDTEGQTNDKVVDEQEPEKHNWKYTDNTLSALKCTCNICGGERIVYVGQEIPTYIGGPTGTQWVVFGAEDSDNNGTNETLLLTTLEVSTERLELGGADAYNNGIEKIEAKVKEIYGNEARAMTIDDVNRTLGYTPAGGMYFKRTNYETTGNFTTKLKDLSTWENIKTNKTNTPDGANTEEALGEYVLDGYAYAPHDIPRKTSNVAKAIVFGNTGKDKYWLASRGVYAGPGYAGFGAGVVYFSSVRSCFATFFSEGGGGSNEFSVRALVSLKSEIPEGGKILVSNE